MYKILFLGGPKSGQVENCSEAAPKPIAFQDSKSKRIYGYYKITPALGLGERSFYAKWVSALPVSYEWRAK